LNVGYESVAAPQKSIIRTSANERKIVGAAVDTAEQPDDRLVVGFFRTLETARTPT